MHAVPLAALINGPVVCIECIRGWPNPFVTYVYSHQRVTAGYRPDRTVAAALFRRLTSYVILIRLRAIWHCRRLLIWRESDQLSVDSGLRRNCVVYRADRSRIRSY
jgi:hypothetical protein